MQSFAFALVLSAGFTNLNPYAFAAVPPPRLQAYTSHSSVTPSAHSVVNDSLFPAPVEAGQSVFPCPGVVSRRPSGAEGFVTGVASERKWADAVAWLTMSGETPL